LANTKIVFSLVTYSLQGDWLFEQLETLLWARVQLSQKLIGHQQHPMGRLVEPIVFEHIGGEEDTLKWMLTIQLEKGSVGKKQMNI
jgi:hypothetical protein